MERVNIPMEELIPLVLLQLEHGPANLTVKGSSMHPMLQSGRDSVILEKPGFPVKGHPVLLYRRENGDYILHRLVRRKKAGFLCCGDNQWQTELVCPEQVVATVTGFVRKGKRYYVNHQGYRFYAWLWSAALPVRRPLLAVRRWLGKLRKIRRRKTK